MFTRTDGHVSKIGLVEPWSGSNCRHSSLVDGTSLLPRHRSGLTKTATSQPFWPMCSPFHASTHRIEDPWNGGAFRFLSLRLESAPTFLPATDLDYPRTGQSSSGVHASTYSYVHAYNAGPVESPKSIAHSDPTWLAGAARAASVAYRPPAPPYVPAQPRCRLDKTSRRVESAKLHAVPTT